MKIINGIYSSANIFTTNNAETAIEPYALKQIQLLCDNKTTENTKIAIMPDVHPGIVGTIGFTSTIGKMLMPNLLGNDIGCGMLLAQIKTKNVEFKKMDSLIRENIPSGTDIRKYVHRFADNFDFSNLRCGKHIQEKRSLLSLGTLGSGNHFIEIDKDGNNNIYVIIHSGSRHLGKEVTDYYIKRGQEALHKNEIDIPFEMTYLEDELLNDYIHDVMIVQQFASINRKIILDEIIKGMKWKIIDRYECIHNYIDCDDEIIKAFHAPILRKGAISAKKDEKVIIPINMRDGVILGIGLGNDEWNQSAPHGAGRIMNRSDVKSHFTVSAYKKEMKGIYSSCIGSATLDEAPFAYRNIDDIANAIKDTVHITDILTPIYNFKGGDK
ncbi:MAG: RtcB family protein [Lachnospiraceae bacterium]|nr:RtcB family protein [Lachnospiraceae bacterium]